MLRTAEDVAQVMGNMKGVTMKVGQIMSLMGGAVPEGFAERLSTLQSAAPPMAPELVRQVFVEDFGRPPEKVFRRFEEQPFAAASIGQVHRAQLDDGTKVAVKVQYPGVAEAIGADLANLNTIFGIAGLAARGFDPGPMVEDLRRGIAGELDYRLEVAEPASLLRAVRRPPLHPHPEGLPGAGVRPRAGAGVHQGQAVRRGARDAGGAAQSLRRDHLSLHLRLHAPPRAVPVRPARRQLPAAGRRQRRLPRLRLHHRVRARAADAGSTS